MLDTKFNSVYDVISIFTQFLNLNIFGKRRFYCFMEFYVIHLKKSIKLIIKEWDVSRQDIDLFIEQAITCRGDGRDGRGERTCLSLERLWWPLRAEKMREGLNYDN